MRQKIPPWIAIVAAVVVVLFIGFMTWRANDPGTIAARERERMKARGITGIGRMPGVGTTPVPFKATQNP